MNFQFTALGGLGEVGTNCALLELEGKILVFDCGISFPDDDTLGVDQIAPDFAPILERADDVVGILITHGHQDHIGALPLLAAELDVPIYLPRFATGLLRHALRDVGLDDENFEIVEIRPGQRLEIGPFDAEFIHVNHSIPDTLAVAFHTPAGAIVHTADFKIDRECPFEPPMALERLRELGDEGVRLLFSDSTNILVDGHTSSEGLVRDGILKRVQRAPGRVIVSLFSTNIYRIQALAEIAAATGRQLLLLGRSLQRNVAIARDLGILKLGADVFIEERKAHKLLPSELIIACTGSQAQERAALARMAWDEIAGFRIQPDDHVIFSARAIPGNEAAIARLQDQIVRRRGVIITGDDLHCSGHACRDEQREVLKLLRPQSFVPVHGDHRFLVAHAELAQSMGIHDTHVLDNGETIALNQEDLWRSGNLQVDRICLDRTPIGHLEGDALRSRRRMAARGMAILTVVVNSETSELAEPATIENLGIIDESMSEGLFEDVLDAAEDAFHDLSRRNRLDEERASEAVTRAVSRFFKRELGRRPFIVALVVYT